MRTGSLTSLATLLVLAVPLAGAKVEKIFPLTFSPSSEIQDARP